MTEAVKPTLQSRSLIQWVLVAVLAGLVAIAALPNYLAGQWPWSTDMPVPQLQEMRELNQTPLSLSGWDVTLHETVKIGGSDWALTEYRAAGSDSVDAKTFGLLLKPQKSADKQPEVEWVDLQGAQGWRVNDLQTVRMSAEDQTGQPVQVSTRYFRGLNENGTLAVMQWYAWPTGGHFAPGRWFWADQARQWQQRERMPWVAVCVLLPIEPVGDIRPHTEAMVAIAQAIQENLLVTALQPDSGAS
jgi:cyanoexosortase B-associated protein